MNERPGLRVLVVEDDAVISMLIEDMLDELGHVIDASVARLATAFELLDSLHFDVAILDINIHGEPVFPLAQRLSTLGKPMIFSTGYGQAGLPAEFEKCPVLAKPYSLADLKRVLEALR